MVGAHIYVAVDVNIHINVCICIYRLHSDAEGARRAAGPSRVQLGRTYMYTCIYRYRYIDIDIYGCIGRASRGRTLAGTDIYVDV